MNSLESRKQLLIAESELNRALLGREWQLMSGGIHALTKQVKTFSLFATSTASLIGVLAALRGKKPAPTIEKPSWLQTILKYVPAVGSLWSEFRARPKS